MKTHTLKTFFVGLATLLVTGLSHAGQLEVCLDFNSNTAPPGTTLHGLATVGGAAMDGALHLTEGMNDQCGALLINDPLSGNQPGPIFAARWRSLIGNGATGADGYSFNWGSDVNLNFPCPGTSLEDGTTPSGLVVAVDTFDNGCGDCNNGTDYGIEIRWRGQRVAWNSTGREISLDKSFLRKAAFVNAQIRIEANGNATFDYDGIVASGTLANWVPVSGNFLVGGRTGGANDQHYIDDLCVRTEFTDGPVVFVRQPANATVLEGGSATFEAVVDGTAPYAVRWQRSTDGGATFTDIAGATTLRYTVSNAGEANNQNRFRIVAQNAAPSSATSQAAILTVNLSPRVTSARTVASVHNEVHVFYTRPVTLNTGTYNFQGAFSELSRRYGADHSEVIITIGSNMTLGGAYTVEVSNVVGENGATLEPNPTTASFRHGPGCFDFNNNQVPAGTTISGTAYVTNGVMHLTDAGQAGACGAWFIPDFSGGAPIPALFMTWKSYIGDGNGADGYSFSWGADVPAACPWPGAAEDGGGNGLRVGVDTFDNGVGCDDCATGTDYGVELVWRGQRVAYDQTGRAAAGNKNFLRKGRFVDVVLQVGPTGAATLNYDGIILNANLTGWDGVPGGNFVFAARTGGANDNQWVDDVRINCLTPGPVFIVDQPQDATVLEGATATFSVKADGTPLYSYRWQKRAPGAPAFTDIAGATSDSYTTPPNPGTENGALYRVIVQGGEGGPVTSREALLTVQINPRLVDVFTTGDGSDVHVTYTRPVNLDGTYSFDGGLGEASRQYGANHSEVIISLTGPPLANTPYTITIQDVTGEGSNLPILPNPSTRVFSHVFAPFCADFNDNQLPAGAQLLGTATISGGILHLTDDGIGGACGGFYLPSQTAADVPVTFMAISWSSLVYGLNQNESLQFGRDGADGYSFTWGQNVTPACVGEDGQAAGQNLAVSIDTFDNGSQDLGIRMSWRGLRIARDGLNADPGIAKDMLRKNRFVHADLIVDRGRATFTYDGHTISGDLPGFGAGMLGGNFLFGGRTGGAHDNQWIDNLKINCFTDGAAVAVTDPANVTVNEGETATFDIDVDGTPPLSFQWQVSNDGGMTFSDIAGATFQAYTTPPTGEADNGDQFRVVVSNRNGSDTSAAATLTVRLNPRVVDVSSRCDSEVRVTYSRPVQLSPGTYTLSGSTLLCTDFNSANGGYTVDTPAAYDGPWVWNSGTGTWQQNGQGPESNHPNTSMLNSPIVTVTSPGLVNLSFVHRYSFESGFWDGGQVRVRVNGVIGGVFTTVPDSAFSQGTYNGSLVGTSTSALAGQRAFVENSPNRASGQYITSEATLGTFNANDEIEVQFIAASDGNTQGQFLPNWEIDSVCITAGGVIGTQVAYGANHNEVILTTAESLAANQTYSLEIRDVVGEEGPVILPNPTVVQFRNGFGTPFCADFNDNQVPPGSQLIGLARVADGFLHMTDAANDQCGGIYIANRAGALPLDFLVATWRSYVGDGNTGADGYSMSWGPGVNPSFACPGTAVEDGVPGADLVVAVDTFDSGCGDCGTGTDYGIEIMWRGQRVAYDQTGRATTGDKSFLRKSRFVDAEVVVDNGVATFTYDGIRISGPLPNFGSGVAGGNFAFAGRTGGANDNQWIDDLRINCFSRCEPTITGPADVTVTENCVNRATFVAEADGLPPYNFQWTENGVVVASGTTHNRRISYTTDVVNRSDNNNRYQVRITNEIDSAISREAVLTVNTTAPSLVSAEGLDDRVMVIFSEGMDPATAGNPANYAINGHSVTAAFVFRGGDRVQLTVSPALPFVDCLRLTVTGVKDCTTLDTVNGTVPILIKGPVQSSGPDNLIVVEAEDWNFNRSPGTMNVGGTQGRLDENYWVLRTALAGYVGAGYAEAIPNLNSFGGNLPSEPPFNASPRTDYAINFPAAGTYYVWARGNSGNDGGNNSFHAAVDLVSTDDRGRRIGNAVNDWGNPFGWVSVAQDGRARVDVATAGVHTFSILMREDGMKIDRFVLTTSEAFALTGADPGPAASPRASVADSTPPTITCPGNMTAQCGAPVTYSASAVDNCDGPITPVCTPPSGSVFPGGVTTVTCRATDSRGNGSSCTFTVAVADTAPPSITCPADISSATGQDVTWQVQASDACSPPVTVVCVPPSGSDFPMGTTPVTCTGTDAAGVSASCTFRVNVGGGGPPTCAAVVEPEECLLTFGSDPRQYVLSLDNATGCIVLNGSGSTDPDGDPLTFTWTIDGTNIVSGEVVPVCLEVGCHTVELAVSDGGSTTRCRIEVCVIGAGEAVEDCIELVENTQIERKNKRPLLASLKAAQASFDRGNITSGRNQLKAFQNKVRAQVGKSNPAEAELFIECAQRIIDAINCSAAVEVDLNQP